jgi:hypothetical protein
VKLKLAVNGKEYVAEAASLTNVTIGELRTIKRETGMTLDQLHERLVLQPLGDGGDNDIDLYAVLTYLLMSHSGAKVTWADVEAIPLVDLASGLSSVEDEPAAETVELPAEVPVVVDG